MIIALTVGLTVATYGLVRFGYGAPITLQNATVSGAAPAIDPPYQLAGNQYVGVAAKLGLKSSLAAFEKVMGPGRQPGIVEFYTGFGTSEYPFPSGAAMFLARRNILSLIQINPYNVKLADVAAGKYDAYLRSYADKVKEFHSQVAISFAHEMNGWWYPWGLPKYSSQAVIKAKASAFIGAWRRIYDVFQHEGAKNVTWVWTVSRDANWPGQPTPQTWWPGSKYVTWVGLDGYFRKPRQTFSFVFDRQLARIRQFTNMPVLIGETAAGYIPDRPAQIASLFQGVQTRKNLKGFIWFDINAKEQWNIDDKPHAIAAFQHQMSLYPPARRGKTATPGATPAPQKT